MTSDGGSTDVRGDRLSRARPESASSSHQNRARVAGALGAASALAATELVGLLAPTRPSLLIAVETWFLDTFAGALKSLAVALFGTNDKAALAAGTVIVALLFGSWLGRLELRRPGWGAGGLGVFGLLGVLATWRNPQGSVGLGLLSAVVGVASGVGVLLLLLERFGLRSAPWTILRAASQGATRRRSGEGMALVTANRRDVLAWGVGTGAAVVTLGAVGQEVRSSLRSSAAPLPTRLPAALSTEALPAGPTFEVDGLTPYVVANEDFYRIDTALQTPAVDTDGWRLRITGRVGRELELTYADLLARDLVEEVVTLSCVSNEVGGDLVGNARWRGVQLRDLLEEAGVDPSATQIMSESVDGFTAGFPTAILDDPDRSALLAVGMNGKPLPRAHGFPARLVISGLYGYVSATKWIEEIRLTTLEDEDGYWIPRGWAKDGPVKTQSRIDVPRRGRDLRAGPQPVAGVAWAPSRGISKVEVRVDRGPWQEAELGPVTSDDTWVQWIWEWDAPAGDHEIDVRATDGEGDTQTEERTRVDPDGASGWHSRTVTVG
ncbi:MAG: molybdopterin-dependent oxidoreductase [Iamia sp.]